MRRLALGWACWVTATGAGVGEEVVTLDEAIQQGRAFLESTAGPEALAMLPELDPVVAARFLEEVQRVFEGEYIVDLSAWREGAARLADWLEASPALRGYGRWLQTRLDYFDVAERVRVLVGQGGGGSSSPVGAVTPEQQRRVWGRMVEHRGPPAGAASQVDRLRAIFDAEGVPSELVWLAEVESSFDAVARSPVGAVGLYQLMPATARALGLEVSPQDERLQPEKNAAAAARHLRYLYGRFRDWPLALAAYNAGEGRVGRLLRTSRRARFEDIASRLPAETQLYVPKVEAVLQRRAGSALGKLPAAE